MSDFSQKRKFGPSLNRIFLCVFGADHLGAGLHLRCFGIAPGLSELGGIWHCHVWTPPVLQGENQFEAAVELAVMYPAFSLRCVDRWP